MASTTRGVQHLKTMAGLVDSRRSRSSAGALLELSMLEMERQRLMKEVQRAEERGRDIRNRLTDINKKQSRLQQYVEHRVNVDSASPAADSVCTALPVMTAPADRLKRRRLSY